MRIVYSSRNEVSAFYGREFGAEALDFPLLHLPPNMAEPSVVLSPHKSASGLPCITVHYPGNWTEAQYGGEPYTLSHPLPEFAVAFLRAVEPPKGYLLSYEADHHGPSSTSPIAFVEVGSGPAQWYDPKAYNALFEAVRAAKPKTVELALGVSRSHYPEPFTQISLKLDIGFSHILPMYQIKAMDDALLRRQIAHALNRSPRRPKMLIYDRYLNKSVIRRLRTIAEAFGLEFISAGDLL